MQEVPDLHVAVHPGGRVENCSGQTSCKDTVIGGQAQKEPTVGEIIIVLTPPPRVDPFRSLSNENTAKGKKCP